MPKQIKKIKILDCLIFLFLVLFGVFLRLLPHPANFSPILVIALFGGFYFSKRLAFIMPTLAMVISDIFIGYYEPKLMISVYGSFLLCVVLGFWLKKNTKWYTVLGGSVLGAVLFFLTTNFAVWAFSSWYTKDISGLWQCYLLGLPFLKNSLLGNLFYAAIIFGTYALVKVWVKKISLAAEKETSLI